MKKIKTLIYKTEHMHKTSTRKDTEQKIEICIYYMVCYAWVSILTFLTDVNRDIAVKYKIA